LGKYNERLYVRPESMQKYCGGYQICDVGDGCLL